MGCHQLPLGCGDCRNLLVHPAMERCEGFDVGAGGRSDRLGVVRCQLDQGIAETAYHRDRERGIPPHMGIRLPSSHNQHCLRQCFSQRQGHGWTFANQPL